jgi:hypothetical protein
VNRGLAWHWMITVIALRNAPIQSKAPAADQIPNATDWISLLLQRHRQSDIGEIRSTANYSVNYIGGKRHMEALS